MFVGFLLGVLVLGGLAAAFNIGYGMGREREANEASARCDYTGVHSYEERYDITFDRDWHPEKPGNLIMTSELRTYVRDVCVDCGAVVDRTVTPPESSVPIVPEGET